MRRLNSSKLNFKILLKNMAKKDENGNLKLTENKQGFSVGQEKY